MITQNDTQTQTQQTAPRRYSPLKYQRLLRGWSQQDVVDAVCTMCEASGRFDVGLTTYQLGRWENEQHKPSPKYRKHLCQLFSLNAYQLGFIEPQDVQS